MRANDVTTFHDVNFRHCYHHVKQMDINCLELAMHVIGICMYLVYDTIIYEPRRVKTGFRICENKDADQLRGDREADQRLCFRYIYSTIPLLHTYEISSL